MWAVAAQHKRYNDSLSGYNSLRDPHLRAYFRQPAIRRQLLRANIINKDNKIVDEISSTSSVQRTERRQKRQLYHLLEDLLKQPASLENDGGNNNQEEELLRQIKLAANGSGELGVEDSTILQRLDRMIRAIREHEMITSGGGGGGHSHHPDHQHWRRQGGSRNVAAKQQNQLWSSKSYQDVSSSDRQRRSISREARPKSSYGRTSSRTHSTTSTAGQHSTSTPNLLASERDSAESSVSSSQGRGDGRPHSPNVLLVIQKSLSCANLADDDDVAEEVMEIESVDGDSLTEDMSSENAMASKREALQGGHHFPRLPRKVASTSTTVEPPPAAAAGKFRKWYGNGSTSTVQHHQQNQKGSSRKGQLATAIALKSGPNQRQKVRMTLRYNASQNSHASRRLPRSVKIFQQLAVGGNSILIYDGAVVSGDLFSFDIRPLAASGGGNHGASPFSVILFVNGIRDLRLNTCCAHKHRPGTRLAPDFTLIDVVGGRPCLSCQSGGSSFDNGARGSMINNHNNKALFLSGLENHQQQEDHDDETWLAVRAAIESAEAALAATERRIEGLLTVDQDNEVDEDKELPEVNNKSPESIPPSSPSPQSSPSDAPAVTGGDKNEEEEEEGEDTESLQMFEADEEECKRSAADDQMSTQREGEEQQQQQHQQLTLSATADDDGGDDDADRPTEDSEGQQSPEELPSKKAMTDDTAEEQTEKVLLTTEEGQNTDESQNNQISGEVLAEEEDEDEDEESSSLTTTTTSSSVTTLIQLAYKLDEDTRKDEAEEGEGEGEGGDITEETLPLEMQLLPENDGLDSDDNEEAAHHSLPAVTPATQPAKSAQPNPSTV